MRGEPVLRAEGLVKTYGHRRALDDFTLHVAAGEVAGLVGPNGAGKTTFVEVVTGLIRPEAGSVTVGGVDAIKYSQKARSMLGVCPQETALYPSITVAGHLRLFGALYGLRRGALRNAAAEIAELMSLTDVLGKPTGLLSGGQRKRVQAATALIAEQPLLLLDEPTVGADPLTRTALLNVISARAAAGAAIVYTTHYQPELAELGATIAFARAGRIVARGTQADLSMDDLFLREQPRPEAQANQTERPEAQANQADLAGAAAAGGPGRSNRAAGGPGRSNRAAGGPGRSNGGSS